MSAKKTKSEIFCLTVEKTTLHNKPYIAIVHKRGSRLDWGNAKTVDCPVTKSGVYHFSSPDTATNAAMSLTAVNKNVLFSCVIACNRQWGDWWAKDEVSIGSKRISLKEIVKICEEKYQFNIAYALQKIWR